MNQFWTQYGPILVPLCSVFAFGVAYACLIAWINRKNLLEGYTALAVAFGTLVTLVIGQSMHHPDQLTDLALELSTFAASGTPMIINNLREHYLAKMAERKALSEVMGNG